MKRNNPELVRTFRKVFSHVCKIRRMIHRRGGKNVREAAGLLFCNDGLARSYPSLLSSQDKPSGSRSSTQYIFGEGKTHMSPEQTWSMWRSLVVLRVVCAVKSVSVSSHFLAFAVSRHNAPSWRVAVVLPLKERRVHF